MGYDSRVQLRLVLFWRSIKSEATLVHARTVLKLQETFTISAKERFVILWRVFLFHLSCVFGSKVELVADSLEGMESLVAALAKSRSKSKRDDVKLHATLSEVCTTLSANARRWTAVQVYASSTVVFVFIRDAV